MWAFIPFNLLPKLHALRYGQPVDDFRYFVDSSPKIADVKVDGDWRTYLFFGQGAGGTFYNTLDVTLDDIDDRCRGRRRQRRRRCLLRILPRQPHRAEVELPAKHELRSGRGAVVRRAVRCASASGGRRKTVGETWSDPAIGQIAETRTARTAVLTGSGFLKYSVAADRRTAAASLAGTTFYRARRRHRSRPRQPRTSARHLRGDPGRLPRPRRTTAAR